MPVVTITLMQGYDEETRRRLTERLTDAVSATIAAPLEGITVIVHEVANPVGYMRGRSSRQPGAPLPAPAALVQTYLDAMERRDFAAARGLLADDFTMIFPGGREMRTPEELAEWAAGRYRAARKTYDRVDEIPVEGGVAVYCFGTLAGEWRDGSPFADIRFIDRFTVAQGKIRDQRVWNDLAEARAEAASAA